MKFFLVIFACLLPSFVLAKPATTVQSLDRKISQLRKEIKEYQSSASAMEQLHTKLSSELREFESDFQQKFRKVVIPLLSWPDVSILRKLSGWVEQEHMAIILEKTRQRVVREPLELMSDRELRVNQVANLKEDLQEKLKSLQEKENLLNLQLEEMKILEGRSRPAKSSK